ncbi:MAG: ferrous iron transport protein B [Candidatus Marinimicrobia bacterium]|nr:ferrous iron transport protein B [Candidatus Neomarinimicrobiota bacterium]MCF7921233.1 ferrous iron transport protein B [Candidatus Neomarinimicrobiota bacterium]
MNFNIAVAGNPNCGKTTIFNALTGARQRVGNWPGVTVEKKTGHYSFSEIKFDVVDLPGTYSLSAFSAEETVVRQYLEDKQADVVVNIIDASNLERNLFLTTQLIELGKPLVIVLNMMDMAHEKGLQIDTDTLATLLGAPVVPVVGRTGEGIDLLKEKILRVSTEISMKARFIDISYPRDIEQEIEKLSQLIRANDVDAKYSRWTSVKLLEADKQTRDLVREYSNGTGILEQAKISISRIEGLFQDTGRAAISHARYGFIQGALRECVVESLVASADYSRKIDRVLTNRWAGLPIFGLFMWLMFKLTYDIGSIPMDWIDAGLVALMNFMSGMLPDSMFASLLIDGVIGGVGAIAVFLPNIFILFFIIAVLEDSGYMARVAFIMDRVMHNIGLHGKAFIPMIMGFGCNVPAIMGTRILESRRDRILTVLINPFMSCSARLPVYVLVAGAFFPENAATVIFSMYILGIVAAIASGKLFSRTILKGMSKPFVLELPPYQRPTLRSLTLHTWERGYLFIQKMGTVILVGSVIVWVLGYFPREVELERDYQQERITLTENYDSQMIELGSKFKKSVFKDQRAYHSEMVDYAASASYQELFHQFQLLQENLASEERKELNQLRQQEIGDITEQKWIGRVGKLFEPIVRPLGFTWRESVALITGFVAKEIVVSTYGVLFGVGEDVDEGSQGVISGLRSSGMTPLVALSFLVFTLLYTPCLATVAAIKRETGTWAYTLFSIGYSLVLAYSLAFGVAYFGGMFNWLT